MTISAKTADVYLNDVQVGTLLNPTISYASLSAAPSSEEFAIQEMFEREVDRLLIQVGVKLGAWTSEQPTLSGTYWFVGMLKNMYAKTYLECDEPIRVVVTVNGPDSPIEVETAEGFHWQETASAQWYGPLPSSTPPDGWKTP